MSSQEKNGCGPWWVPNWITCGYFENECNEHDLDYNKGVEKNKADLDFLEKMALKVINTCKSNFIIMLRLFQAAFLYYLASEFGQLAYDRAQRECKDK